MDFFQKSGGCGRKEAQVGPCTLGLLLSGKHSLILKILERYANWPFVTNRIAVQVNGLGMIQQRMRSCSKICLSLNASFISPVRRNGWCDPFKSWQKVRLAFFDFL